MGGGRHVLSQASRTKPNTQHVTSPPYISLRTKKQAQRGKVTCPIIHSAQVPGLEPRSFALNRSFQGFWLYLENVLVPSSLGLRWVSVT